MHILSDNFTAFIDITHMKSLNDIIEVENYLLGVGDSNQKFIFIIYFF